MSVYLIEVLVSATLITIMSDMIVILHPHLTVICLHLEMAGWQCAVCNNTKADPSAAAPSPGHGGHGAGNRVGRPAENPPVPVPTSIGTPGARRHIVLRPGQPRWVRILGRCGTAVAIQRPATAAAAARAVPGKPHMRRAGGGDCGSATGWSRSAV